MMRERIQNHLSLFSCRLLADFFFLRSRWRETAHKWMIHFCFRNRLSRVLDEDKRKGGWQSVDLDVTEFYRVSLSLSLSLYADRTQTTTTTIDEARRNSRAKEKKRKQKQNGQKGRFIFFLKKKRERNRPTPWPRWTSVWRRHRRRPKGGGCPASVVIFRFFLLPFLHLRSSIHSVRRRRFGDCYGRDESLCQLGQVDCRIETTSREKVASSLVKDRPPMRRTEKQPGGAFFFCIGRCCANRAVIEATPTSENTHTLFLFHSILFAIVQPEREREREWTVGREPAFKAGQIKTTEERHENRAFRKRFVDWWRPSAGVWWNPVWIIFILFILFFTQ